MGRINIKGGVWRNTEDEILKAAVMKYGKNQWARIASLLHRKTPKQCKARWLEWLDPSVKKTEWSREEDEKLLHLAKLMPTQWRTIAPIVGRTAAQCLERYEFLLDKAQNRDNETGDDDPRKLKPGEIDPCPETKPARPDPIDMDEDELEMLSEARARLANTQGKKAKRKARERQLEVARRLATMQKHREMRAAGITGRSGFRVNKKRYPLNYNSEIPFEKQPPKGFHDSSVDKPPPTQTDFKNLKLSDLEFESREEKEKKERIKDKEKIEKRKKEDLPGTMKSQSTEPAKKRSKLVLPSPQISDGELESLVKVGQAGEAAIRNSIEDGGSGATVGLLADYNASTPASVSAQLAARTPNVAADNLMQEAQNLIALQNVQTPLKGGLNPEVINSDFSGITPQRQVVATPNTVLGAGLGGMTPFATPGIVAGQATPGAMSSIDGMTPLRDKLSINTPRHGGMDVAIQMSTEEMRRSLRAGLSQLPQPKNDYEIYVPDSDLDDGATVVSDFSRVADQADVDKAARDSKIAQDAAEWALKSEPVKRNLPRPYEVNHTIMRPPLKPGDPALSEIHKAEEMIKEEMLAMLHYDALHTPPPDVIQMAKQKTGQRKFQQAQTQHAAYVNKHPVESYSQEDLTQAHSLLEEEMTAVGSAMGHGDVSTEVQCKVWQECYSQLLYLPSQRRYTRASLVTKKDRIESYEKQLDQKRGQMRDEAKKAANTEKKLKILLAGYQSRGQSLIKSLFEATELVEQSFIELQTFEKLREHELGAMTRRIEALSTDVERQSKRERELQKEYSHLLYKKDMAKQIDELGD